MGGVTVDIEVDVEPPSVTKNVNTVGRGVTVGMAVTLGDANPSTAEYVLAPSPEETIRPGGAG